MEDTELGETEGKLLVRAVTRVEEDTVSRAVHGLESEGVVLDLEREHVLGVVLPVSRGLPELRVEHVGRADLDEATLVVLLTDELHERVVDAHAVGQHEGRSRGQVREEEELLVLGNLAVVALGSLLLELLPLGHLLRVREGHSVNTLERVVLGVTEEVRGRVLGDGERLDAAGVGNVGTETQVDERSTAVDRRRGAIGNLLVDVVLLVLVVLEHLEKDLLGQLEALERLLLLDSLLRDLLNLLVVVLADGLVVAQAHVVEESTLGKGRTVTKAASLERTLTGLTHDVRGRVPEDLTSLVVSFRRVEVEEGEVT